MVTFLSDKGEKVKSDYYIAYPKIAKILPTLSYHIEGRPMVVSVICTKIAEVDEIRQVYSTREDLNIYAIVPEGLFARLKTLYPTEVRELSKWDLLLSIVEEAKLLFDKGCIGVLYNAVDEKTAEGFQYAVNVLKNNYSQFHAITAEDIAKFFYVQDAVFPRQVLLAFLQKKKNRWVLLKRCESFYPKSMVYYAMRDNLDKLIESKGNLYTKGVNDKKTNYIDARNLAMMKRVFLTSIKDPFVLLKFYEGGIMTNDSC